MNLYLSNKIKVVSFLLIVLVLYIHSGFNVEEIGGMKLNNYFQLVLSGWLGDLAVPLFFVVSGYLFFKGTEQHSAQVVKSKIRKRMLNLLPPYIISCLFFVLVFLIMYLLPFTSKFIHSVNPITVLLDMHFTVALKTVFWSNEGSHGPLAFQLWFLKDLIIIVLTTPVLLFFLKHFKVWAVIMLGPLILVENWILPFTPMSILFFSLGGWIFHSGFDIGRRRAVLGFCLFSIYLVFCFFLDKHSIALAYRRVITILGVFGFWYSIDALLSQDFVVENYPLLAKACSFTFFIYLFHEPTLNIIRKVIVFIIREDSLAYLISYLLSPLVFVMLAIGIGSLLRKYVVNIYSFAVGGRL